MGESHDKDISLLVSGNAAMACHNKTTAAPSSTYGNSQVWSMHS